MAENFRLTRIGENNKLMAQIATNGAGISRHRKRAKPKPREGAQVSHKHFLIRHPRRRFINVEAIGIFHQKFAAAHHAKARANLITEFPLNMVEIARQLLVAAHIVAEYLRN